MKIRISEIENCNRDKKYAVFANIIRLHATENVNLGKKRGKTWIFYIDSYYRYEM